MNVALSIGQSATLACILEVTAPKPGNVNRGADFPDCTLNDFLASAVAIGPHMEAASEIPVGETILRSINATFEVSRTNTNLGIVLLLAPLATAFGQCSDQAMRNSIETVLNDLTASDSNNTYEAIRLAKPGGLAGKPRNEAAANMDVENEAPNDLLAAMRAAESYDMIARQYSNGFADIFDFVTPRLSAAESTGSLSHRIIHTQLELMAQFPDSLIQRKCGMAIAAESATRAARVIAAGPIDSEMYNMSLADFDFWLRSDANRRNPGTTADLIAAGLFVALLEGKIQPPFN